LILAHQRTLMTTNIEKPKRFTSKRGLDIVKKPELFFNSYSLFTGIINYKGVSYNLKKIDLKDGVIRSDLPEVHIIDSDHKNPYLIECYDYIVEQEETETGWVDKALYILLEYSDYDLRTYIIKYGALSLSCTLKLIETLIGANYYLQKEMSLAHKDIRPQNIRVLTNEASGNKEPAFKLSYFDDVLKAGNNQAPNPADIFSYMAPELLCSRLVSEQQNLTYFPSPELQALINECPDELRYDPFRADVYSAGLTALSAATGFIFSLKPQNQNFEICRDGLQEIGIIIQNLRVIKSKHQCSGLTEILRIMLTNNPLLRCDFEELAIRLNKMKTRNHMLPYIELVKEESAYELLRQNYWELQEFIQEKEGVYRGVIEKLENEIQRLTEDNKQNANQFKGLDTIVNTLNELSSIIAVDEENFSFISTVSQKKTFDSVVNADKELNLTSMTEGLIQNEQIKTLTKDGSIQKQGLSTKDSSLLRKECEDKATLKDYRAKKMSLGHLRHQEFKNSIIKRRETSNTHDM